MALPTAPHPEQPYRSAITIEGLSSAEQHRGKHGSFTEREEISPIRLSGHIFGEGRIDARFTTRKNKIWRSFGTQNQILSEERDPALVLLQGTISINRGYHRVGPRVFPVAATLRGKELTVTFPGKVKGHRASRQRLYTMTLDTNGTFDVKARIASVPRAFVRLAGCAEPTQRRESSGLVPPIMAEAVSGQAGQYRVVTVSTDADQEWFAIHGERSNDLIAGILNAAEAIYERQLGIRFRIVRQHVYRDSSPYTTDQPGILLTQFADNPDNPTNLSGSKASYNEEVDLKHLFTGKDLTGGVVGIAYIGTVCAAPVMTYGVTQSFPLAALPGIFGHELAHNFGAAHDSSDPKSLMYPNISIPSATYFSQTSLDQIGEHLSEYNSCLSSEYMPPLTRLPLDPDVPDVTPSSTVPVAATPTPTAPLNPSPMNSTLYLMKRRMGPSNRPVVRLYGRLVDFQGRPFSDESVRLRAADAVVAESTTDAEGGYEFFVRVNIAPGARVSVVVEAAGGGLRSNPLSLKRTEARSVSSSRQARQR